MGIIAFPLLAPRGPIGPLFEWGLRSNTAVSRSPFTGATRTAERLGGPQTALLRYRNLHGSEAARLRSWLFQMRGMANRSYVPDFSYVQRGSFAASELFSNYKFASGSTGWEAAAEYSLAVTEGRARSTRVYGGGVAYALRPTAAVNVTQYAPYAARFHVLQGRAAYSGGFRIDDSIDAVVGSALSGFGLHTQSFVTRSTTLRPAITDQEATGLLAGDFLEFAYGSLARCALVDNAPNLLLQSDEFDTSWTATRTTIDDQAANAPDGSGNADIILEDASAATTHYVSQDKTGLSSSAADYTLSCSLKAGTRTWAALQLTESTGGHTAIAFLNLSTGAAGTVSVSGANWTNARVAVTAEGDNWFRLHLTARKTSAATTITSAVIIAEADNDITFNGVPANSIRAWRASLAQSSVPIRAVQTTTTAASGTSQTGSALHLKGLPASTSGLLLTDDLVEIITPSASEMRRVSAALNSDAAGLGYLRFEPPLVYSPADNAPVIIQRPMMRCLLDDNSVDWSAAQGVFTDLDFRVVEDVVPA